MLKAIEVSMSKNYFSCLPNSPFFSLTVQTCQDLYAQSSNQGVDVFPPIGQFLHDVIGLIDVQSL